jgi:hypothetical protein
MASASPASTPRFRPASDKLFAGSLLALLAALCAVYTWRPLQGGEDFWAHAAVGRWIWEHHAIPRQTLWLWGAPPVHWIAHSWLSELFFYTLMRIGGAGFVLAATALFVALPFVWLWRLWLRRGGSALFAALFFLLAITCAAVRFQPRPELFSYLFLTLLWLHLIRRTENPGAMKKLSAREVLSLVALFVVWTNCHGGVALGLAMLLLTVFAEALQTRSLQRAAPLLALTALCAAAVNLNPYGVAYWSALAPVGGDMFKLIDEWKSPLAAPALPPLAIALVLFVVFIALLAWIGNRERRWSQLAWLLFLTAFFFMARRNLWPLMLVSTCVAAANAQSLCAARLMPSLAVSRATRRIAQIAIIALLAAWVVSSLAPEALARKRGVLALRAVSPHVPRGVARYVLEHNPPAPLFNDYLRSGYFHWRFAGRPRLYIDLLNAYDDHLLRDYFDIIARTPRGRTLFEKLKINTVVFGRWNEKSRLAPLAGYLDHSAEWRRAYSGDDGAVWVRRVPATDERK